MRNQFTFYRSFWDAIKLLKRKDDRLSVLEAIAAYALDGQEPQMTATAESIFCLIKPVLDTAEKKSNGGKKTARQAEDNRKTTTRQAQENGKEIEKEIEGEGENEIEKESSGARARDAARFLPPSVEDVAAYCRERGNGIDAQAFCDFYASKGWRVGNAPMKDWQAAVRTWEQRRKSDRGKEWDFRDLG